jgi:hypothetical protein
VREEEREERRGTRYEGGVTLHDRSSTLVMGVQGKCSPGSGPRSDPAAVGVVAVGLVAVGVVAVGKSAHVSVGQEGCWMMALCRRWSQVQG